MLKPTFQKSTTKAEIKKLDLHRLLNAVAMRAYKLGHRDGALGLPVNTEKARVSARSVNTIYDDQK